MNNVQIVNSNVNHFGDISGGSVTYNMNVPKQNVCEFIPELEILLKDAEDDKKQSLQNAIQAANNNDENTFITALKKVASIGENIFTKVATGVFESYLQANGLLPTAVK